MKKKEILKLVAFLFILIQSNICFSQISTGSLAPNRYAQLDITNSKKGILIPRIELEGRTNPQPISSDPGDLPISLLVFNTKTTPDLDIAYYYWNGAEWNKVVIKEDLATLPKSPWNKANTTTTAELNTDNIYQVGKVGIGEANMTPNALLDVRGDVLINNLTIGKGNGINNDTNTGVGYQTLQNNDTGTRNTSTGFQALKENTIGNNNVATGHNALSINKTGSNNTAIGDSAGPTSDNLSNTIAIGYDTKVEKSNTIQLGNTDIENTYISGNLNIGTINKKANLNVIGGLLVTETEELPNATTLVIDDNGKVGKAPVVPPTETKAKVMFMQSRNLIEYETPEEKNLINSGNPVVVNWDFNDVSTNNIVSFNDTENTFIIQEDGIYELSGYLSYTPNATINESYVTGKNGLDIDLGRVGVNVSIQIQEKGTNSWEDLAATRYLYSGTVVQGTAATIIIAPAIKLLKIEDKIRMIFNRPGGSLGVPHGTAGVIYIIAPTGIAFSRGIKILKL